jgi:hypothetical protein
MVILPIHRRRIIDASGEQGKGETEQYTNAFA